LLRLPTYPRSYVPARATIVGACSAG